VMVSSPNAGTAANTHDAATSVRSFILENLSTWWVVSTILFFDRTIPRCSPKS
jgi:hypothetical protein